MNDLKRLIDQLKLKIYFKVNNNIQLLDEVEQNIVIFQWRAEQLFADTEGRGK
jgi:hypothetical protein